MFAQVKLLLWKEITLEWRNRYALNGILLYVVGAVYLCYMSFSVKRGVLHPITWNALFWIIQLFTSIHAITKSFGAEAQGRNLYYYIIVSPSAIIVSKTIYNACLLMFLSLISFLSYSLVMGNPIEDLVLYTACLLISALAFSGTLTLVSAIASKAGSGNTLMAILSFPVILPLLLLIIKISKNAMDGLETSSSYKDLSILAAISLIIFSTSFVLYPYLHKN